MSVWCPMAIGQYGRLCSAFVVVLGLASCTTISQNGSHDSACANNSACSQGFIHSSSAARRCKARTLNISPRVVASSSHLINWSQKSGVYDLLVSGYQWAGIFIKLPVSGCGYNISFDATLYAQPSVTGPQTGYGYGFGACDTWSGREPRGFEIQYSDFRDQSNKLWSSAGWIPLGYPNNLTLLKLPVDFMTHAWSINIRNDKLAFTEDDGASSSSFPLTNAGAKTHDEALLPGNCKDTGVFLRVYNTRAIFSSFSADELAS